MAQIDVYRRNIGNKRKQINKLSSDRVKEREKISKENKNIINAKKSISRTKSESTIKSKLRTIGNAEKKISDSNKKIADLESKMLKLDKDILNEEKKLSREEKKIEDKRLNEEKKRIRSSEKLSSQLQNSIHSNEVFQEQVVRDIEELKNIPEKIIILFISSNPKDQSSLRLDEEAREIEENIKKSKHRDSIEFKTIWATRPLDILDAINEYKPTIIHFSGHGTADGSLVFEDLNGNSKFVSKDAIVQVISSESDTVKLVFFNNCFSYIQAKEIMKNIDFAIGMFEAISDRAAIIFSSKFYSSIGFGNTVKKAFNHGISALMLEGISEEDTPRLYCREDSLEIDKPLVLPDEGSIHINQEMDELSGEREDKYIINVHINGDGQVNIAEDKSNINAVQNNNASDLEKLSKEIKDILRDIDLDKEIKENIEDNVEVLECELLEENPRKGFIRTAIEGLENSLPNIKNHIELTANITSIIGFAMSLIK
ncbi:hypothetical protein [Anaerosalibacter bizertensis]|uniref:hypothetical protein n=1 Tax=Anaerosalibacter bizertensis TaxID=932217 RepID=UPI0018A6ACBE|nr:hypothetical protein [Anaerosalibacter bizertensis]